VRGRDKALAYDNLSDVIIKIALEDDLLFD